MLTWHVHKCSMFLVRRIQNYGTKFYKVEYDPNNCVSIHEAQYYSGCFTVRGVNYMLINF